MKSLSLLFVITLLSSGCAVARLPKAKITYRVVDQAGNPIEGAHVDVGFIEASGRSVTGFTDTNGIFVAEDISSGGAGSLVKKEGFYWGGGGCSYTNLNKLLHRFEPWNPTVEVVMKEIRNPVPMIGRSKAFFPDFPEVYSEPVGFDLEKGDWVSPHGKGVHSDFVFTKTLFGDDIEGATTVLTFFNEHDGIMEYPFDKNDYSWFKWPYEAPLTGYTNSVSRFYKRYEITQDYSGTGAGYFETAHKIESNHKQDKEINYIFRVRTKVDEDGKVVRACYGKITGEIGTSFNYWFNPNPTSRSLEHDKKKSVLLE